MSAFKLGSRGDEVRHIQQRLQTLGIYHGPLDGVFGGGTEAATRFFQSRAGLGTDGVVGPLTWKKLFKEEIPPAINTYKPIDYRCLALTSSFETGATIPDCFAGLSGDFDGQGISFGVLQWNFGQDSLQPLLKRMCTDYGETARQVFHGNHDRLTAVLSGSKAEQMAFARSIQDRNRKTINEPWRGMFKALGRTDEFQRIQLECVNSLYKAAQKLCADYGLWSERGVALMFDINVQNGSISSGVRTRIFTGFQALLPSLDAEAREVERLRVIANCRAEAANARWVEDVRARKLCIANGGGPVHGIMYDVDGQFGIGLRQWGE